MGCDLRDLLPPELAAVTAGRLLLRELNRLVGCKSARQVKAGHTILMLRVEYRKQH